MPPTMNNSVLEKISQSLDSIDSRLFLIEQKLYPKVKAKNLDLKSFRRQVLEWVNSHQTASDKTGWTAHHISKSLKADPKYTLVVLEKLAADGFVTQLSKGEFREVKNSDPARD